jgi:hypothetical protein
MQHEIKLQFQPYSQINTQATPQTVPAMGFHPQQKRQKNVPVMPHAIEHACPLNQLQFPPQ